MLFECFYIKTQIYIYTLIFILKQRVMKKLFLILGFLVSSFLALNAQVLSVAGHISDVNGAGVNGVQVTISNPMWGIPTPLGIVTTDNNGYYYWVDTVGFIGAGQGILTVSAMDCDGSYLSQTLTYLVPSSITLNANFTYCSNSGGGTCFSNFYAIPDSSNYMTVHFQEQAFGAGPFTYSWDFGDGTTGSTASPSHTYSISGYFVACLTITDATGCNSSSCQSIYVANQNCFTTFTSTPSPSNNMSFTFTATTAGGNGVYFWDFGDGVIDTTSGATATHTFAQAGLYWVSVTVYDPATGCFAYDYQMVTAGNYCYTSFYYYSDSVNYLTNTFYAQSSSNYPTTYAWDFGDGNTSTAATPTHTYAQAGTYNVCVTATDSSGCVSTECQTVYVFNYSNCFISFTSTPDSSNYTYTFAVDSASAGTYYVWDFGDGFIDTVSGANATYTYQYDGWYYVCLYAFDPVSGCATTYCELITVGYVNPCQAYIQYYNVPGSSTFDFYTYETGVAPFTYSWDFGDGNTSTAATPSHTYNTSNSSYTVTLTVTDANGCVSVDSTWVWVYPFSNSGAIAGFVWKDTTNFTFADATVYLIAYDSTANSLTAIDTVQAQQGFFEFYNIPAGSYLVKAALTPNDPDFANYLPTYFEQSLTWGAAQYVSPIPFGMPAFISLQLIAGNNPGGPGFIGGFVMNGAGRPVDGNVTLIEDIADLEPMAGVSVLLLDANNNPVTHTITATDGSYQFANIAMGDYKVHVEETGKVTFPATLTIDANSLNHSNVHFTIHSSMVTLTGLYEVENVEGFNVFPNPIQDLATVQIDLKENMDLTMTITNLVGQEVVRENKTLNAGNNTFNLDMSSLPTGLYLLSLKSGSDVITYKLQKM
jgi:PKD repeat protein